jgi:hypothetical protein
MLQIIYASAAVTPFTREDLVELLKIARQRNTAADISGLDETHRLFRFSTRYTSVKAARNRGVAKPP